MKRIPIVIMTLAASFIIAVSCNNPASASQLDLTMEKCRAHLAKLVGMHSQFTESLNKKHPNVVDGFTDDLTKWFEDYFMLRAELYAKGGMGKESDVINNECLKLLAAMYISIQSTMSREGIDRFDDIVAVLSAHGHRYKLKRYMERESSGKGGKP